MTIPYNSPGQRAFDVFRRTAARLYKKAQEETDNWILETQTDGKSIGERHADGQYQRILLRPDGTEMTICYDYRSGEVIA